MISYDWEFVYATCFHSLFGETEREREGRGVVCIFRVQLGKFQWWENTEEAHAITSQIAYNFSVSLKEYLENLTWKNWALLWQIRLTRTSAYVASALTVTGNSQLGQAAPLTSLIRAAALLRKMHVYIFVIYFLAETQQLQQFLREFSDISYFLSVLGAIDCTHNIPNRLTSLNSASYWNRKSFNFLAMMGLHDAKFQLSVEDRKSSGRGAFLVSLGKLAGLSCLK